jgi:hypothetical protein
VTWPYLLSLITTMTTGFRPPTKDSTSPSQHWLSPGDTSVSLGPSGDGNNSHRRSKMLTLVHGSNEVASRTVNCVPCLAGQRSLHGICRPCGRGSYSSSRGARECEACPEGTFVERSGRAACPACAFPSWSTVGAHSCRLARVGVPAYALASVLVFLGGCMAVGLVVGKVDLVILVR